MTPEEEYEIALHNYRCAKKVASVLNSTDGKEVLAILAAYFNCHLTAGAVAKFNTNETFYHSGSQAVFLTINQIIEGSLWGEPEPPEILTEPDTLP